MSVANSGLAELASSLQPVLKNALTTFNNPVAPDYYPETVALNIGSISNWSDYPKGMYRVSIIVQVGTDSSTVPPTYISSTSASVINSTYVAGTVLYSYSNIVNSSMSDHVIQGEYFFRNDGTQEESISVVDLETSILNFGGFYTLYNSSVNVQYLSPL